MVTVTGNTYPVRELLKGLGARWNKAAGGWDVPEDRAAEARAIVDAAGPAAPRKTGSGGQRWQRGGGGRRRYHGEGSYTRFSSGAEVYTNRRGRCEDAPCCGCCS